MRTLATIDPIPRRFRESAKAPYGPALDRMVLFGPRVRGDPREASDNDLAVFLKQTGGKPGQARIGQDQAPNNQPLWSPPKLST